MTRPPTETVFFIPIFCRGLLVPLSGVRFDLRALPSFAPYRNIPTSIAGWLPSEHGRRTPSLSLSTFGWFNHLGYAYNHKAPATAWNPTVPSASSRLDRRSDIVLRYKGLYWSAVALNGHPRQGGSGVCSGRHRQEVAGVSRFWLTHNRSGRLLGVVIMDSVTLIATRTRSVLCAVRLLRAIPRCRFIL